MSSPSLPALQQLHRLDKYSFEFPDQLTDVLCEEKYQQCAPNLQGDDSVWLIGYLVMVRRCIALPHSPLKPPQALDLLDPFSPAFRKCLSELRTISSTSGILPTSYALPSGLLNIAPEPFASGGSGDVYEGTLDGSRVCIKRIWAYIQDGPQKATTVRYPHRHLSRSPLPRKSTDLLSRGYNVEALETPKHRIPTGCHYHFHVAARFGLDVWRGSAGIPQEKSRCGST